MVFNLAKMMVSVLPKELEYEVEKLKYKKLEVKSQPRITNKSELPVGEKTILNPQDVLQSCLINTVKGKTKRGRRGGRLKREEGLFEKRLNSGFTVRLSSQAYVHFWKQTSCCCYQRFEPTSHYKSRLSLIARENVVVNRTVVDSD